MAVPKKRKFSSAKNMRRSAWIASMKHPTVISCPKCSEPMQPHRVCPSCGTYKGRAVVQKEEAEAKAKA